MYYYNPDEDVNFDALVFLFFQERVILMLREAKYVNAIYKSGSFSKAAAALFISQPSLSATIRRLENELGTTSFYCCYSLPIHLNPFRSKYPNISINLNENTSSEEMIKTLRLGQIDFALSSNPVGFEEFKKLFFLKKQLILAVPGAWEVNDSLIDYQLSFKDVLNGRQRSQTCPKVWN